MEKELEEKKNRVEGSDGCGGGGVEVMKGEEEVE